MLKSIKNCRVTVFHPLLGIYLLEAFTRRLEPFEYTSRTPDKFSFILLKAWQLLLNRILNKINRINYDKF